MSNNDHRPQISWNSWTFPTQCWQVLQLGTGDWGLGTWQLTSPSTPMDTNDMVPRFATQKLQMISKTQSARYPVVGAIDDIDIVDRHAKLLIEPISVGFSDTTCQGNCLWILKAKHGRVVLFWTFWDILKVGKHPFQRPRGQSPWIGWNVKYHNMGVSYTLEPRGYYRDLIWSYPPVVKHGLL